mgnify:CR=1 FL=1
MSKDKFTIIHTAEPVTYTVTGFVAKNGDELSKELANVCLTSSKEKVAMIFALDVGRMLPGESTKPKKPNPLEKFLGYKFKKQMLKLMKELNSCDCHFIRCFKPNKPKK